MTADIERTISACDTCAQFQRSPQQEPMMSGASMQNGAHGKV